MRSTTVLGLVAVFLGNIVAGFLHRDAQQFLSASDPSLKHIYGDDISGARTSYEDQQVWRMGLSELLETERESVREVLDLMNLDIWRQSRTEIDIRIPRQSLSQIQAILPPSLNYTLFIPDVSSLATESLQTDSAASQAALREEWDVSNLDTPFHSAYHPIADVYDFGSALVSAFNEKQIDDGKLVMECIVIGNTFEDREIRGFRVKWVKGEVQPTPTAQPAPLPTETDGPDEGEDDEAEDGHHEEGHSHHKENKGKKGKKGGKDKDGKKGHKGKKGKGKKKIQREFVVQSGSHAREWVGPSSAMYFLHSLLLTGVNDPVSEEAILLKSFIFTVVPNINPDGYEYSREHRMWRKNRQDVGSRSCSGIDLNSNWGYKWRKPQTSSPCSDSFAGREAFEAYETKAMAKYLDKGIPWSDETEFGKGKKDKPVRKVRAFLDLHSYGQLFMFPFAHSCDDFPPDAEMLMEASLGVAKAMRVEHGETYQTGQACELTYRAPGDSIDYAYGTSDIRWSFSAELRDTGTYGFLLPPSLIRAAAGEITTGLTHLAKFIYNVEIVN